MNIKDSFDKIGEKLKQFSKNPNFPKVMIFAFIIIMLIILFADFEKEDDVNLSSGESDFIDSESYAQKIEEDLCEIIAVIEGVGELEVMVNLSGTREYVFAEEITNNGGRNENELVIIDNNSEKEAVVKKINTPSISGAVIVCEGGDDPKICEKIYKAVSIALNLPTNRIYVAEMK